MYNLSLNSIETDLLDIYKNMLIKSKEKITPALINTLACLLKKDLIEIPLASTTIANDLLSIINAGIYKTIFSNFDNLKRVIDVIKSITLTKELYLELEQIKKNAPCIYNHILSVTALCIQLCLDMKDESYDLTNMAKIGFVHDLGKSRIPLEVLKKTTPLTNYEFQLIQTHPIIEYALLTYYLKDNHSDIALAAFSHHERLDGTGYPRGIHHLNKYTQTIIPCDVFDALINQRPYRNEPFSTRAALDLLLEEAEKGKISKKFVYCIISYARKDRPHYKNLKISADKRGVPPQINYYGLRVDE